MPFRREISAVHPEPDTYDFALADKYVEFGEKNHMFVIGHNLVWYSQTPKWVFEDEKGNPVNRTVVLNYPLLFNRSAQPKPAFKAVIQAAPKKTS